MLQRLPGLRRFGALVVAVVGRERLEVAWRIYERVYLPSLAAQTHRGYRAAARRFLAELPENFTMADLMLWRGRMVEARRLSVSYINQAIKIMRAVTRRAGHVSNDMELASLFAQLQTLKEPIRAPRCPPPDYVDRVLAPLRNPAERAFVLLTSLAGLRVSEVLGLRPEDWEPSTGVLQVIRQRHRGLRKNGRPHYVTMKPRGRLRRALEWTIAHHAEIVPWQAPKESASIEYLFPWTHTYVEAMIQRIRDGLGEEAKRYMPRGTALHAGRHWGTTELAKKGTPLFEIQAWRGDADSSMTATYVAMVRGSTAGSVDALESKAHAYARKPARKVTRCPAATRDIGRRRASAGINPPSGPTRPGGITKKETGYGNQQGKPSRGRED